MNHDASSRTSEFGASGKIAGGSTLAIRLLATSDVHVAITPHDYFTDTDTTAGSLARTATLIAEAREEQQNTFLFDNGDFLQGGLLGDFIALSEEGPNPVIEVMNELGYDAANLGNHEFSVGIPALTRAMNEARFPIISSNSFHSGSDDSFAHPWVVLNKCLTLEDGGKVDFQIGVVGVLPPQTAIWDQRSIAGNVRFADMVSSAKKAIEDVRNHGADIVVVLAHCGIGPEDAPPMAEHAGLAIAGLDGVDALVLGHVHLPFPSTAIPPSGLVDPVRGTLNGVPTIMPGVFGSHLGVIDLTVQRGKAGWKVTSAKASLRAVAYRSNQGLVLPKVRPDQRLLKRISPMHDAARNWVRRPIGHSRINLHSYFAMVTDVPAIQVIHQAQIAHVQEKLRGTEWQGTPILSATAPFKAGGRAGPENYTFVPAGDLLVRHMADLYVYPNTIVAILVTGAELISWLERSSQVFQTVNPGKGSQGLLNLDIAPFHFDTIGGVSYEIDLSCPPCLSGGKSGRICNLTWQGRPVEDDQIFVLATNSYRASGSGGFFQPDPDRIILSSDRQCREVLGQYMTVNASDTLQAVPGWKFRPMGNTSVIFETSPASAAYLGDVKHLDLASVGMNSDGFLQLILAL